MKGKLYELRAEVVMYYWSESGEPPNQDDADSALLYEIGNALDADVAPFDSPYLPQGWDKDSLVYGDHDGDMTLGDALDAMAAQREKAAFDARQERLL
jgi:hypothetical protein